MKRILSLILLLLGGLGISQAAFYTRIPYQNVAGKMQVKVSVGGVEGTFIFDTGAPVCLTHSFAQKVNLTKIQEMKFVDSNGQEFTWAGVYPGLVYAGCLEGERYGVYESAGGGVRGREYD